ncbi:MAG: MarR family transcriptional regulator [Alphaproteobacteria bacterium]|nr:MarR family transcriptional regulator [Alphaproteobacteria bacterium]
MAANSHDDGRPGDWRRAPAPGYSQPESDPSVRPADLALLIDRTARAVYAAEARRTLTPSQWGALRYLKRARNADPTLMGLVRFQKVAPATASETIALLVKRGLLAKERDPADRRQFLLRLTEEAELLMDGDPLRRLADALAELDALTLACMGAGLERALAALAAAADGEREGLD